MTDSPGERTGQTSPPDVAAAPLVWPFPLIAYADHCARSYALFWSKLAAAHDPAEASKAEAELGRSLSREAYTAWLDLCFIPTRVWTSMMAQPPERLG